MAGTVSVIDGDGTAKLCDFGTARQDTAILSKQTHKSTRMVIGTAAYMPAEYYQVGIGQYF